MKCYRICSRKAAVRRRGVWSGNGRRSNCCQKTFSVRSLWERVPVEMDNPSDLFMGTVSGSVPCYIPSVMWPLREQWMSFSDPSPDFIWLYRRRRPAPRSPSPRRARRASRSRSPRSRRADPSPIGARTGSPPGGRCRPRRGRSPSGGRGR
jgi:hypothetical protein